MNSSPNTYYIPSKITQSMRERLLGQHAHLFWFTGLSGAGKSTLAEALQERMYKKGFLTYCFDGDNIRHGLCCDLGFSQEERLENIRRIAEMCKLFIDTGIICFTAFISPTIAVRKKAKEIVGEHLFSEIYVKCPLEVCEARDVKGNYKKARLGIIKNYTGISSCYEEPQSPNIIVDTSITSKDECIKLLEEFILKKIQ